MRIARQTVESVPRDADGAYIAGVSEYFVLNIVYVTGDKMAHVSDDRYIAAGTVPSPECAAR